MRFLADESCDFGVVRALREADYDVIAVSELATRLEDQDVIRFSVEERRILLTEDKDFGRLVYAHGTETHGVIFLRFPTSAHKTISMDILSLVKEPVSGCLGASSSCSRDEFGLSILREVE